MPLASAGNGRKPYVCSVASSWPLQSGLFTPLAGLLVS